jgi:hypothetical protein
LELRGALDLDPDLPGRACAVASLSQRYQKLKGVWAGHSEQPVFEAQYFYGRTCLLRARWKGGSLLERAAEIKPTIISPSSCALPFTVHWGGQKMKGSSPQRGGTGRTRTVRNPQNLALPVSAPLPSPSLENLSGRRKPRALA